MFSVMLKLYHSLSLFGFTGFNRWWRYGSSMQLLRGIWGSCEGKHSEGKIQFDKAWIINLGAFFCLLVLLFQLIASELTWPSNTTQRYSRTSCTVCTRKQLTVQGCLWLAYLSEEKRIRGTSEVCAWVCLCPHERLCLCVGSRCTQARLAACQCACMYQKERLSKERKGASVTLKVFLVHSVLLVRRYWRGGRN